MIKPIKSEADYDSALAVIDNLMGAAPNTPESDELEILVTLAEAYEAKGRRKNKCPILVGFSAVQDRGQIE